jgi:type IV pilus assembly protein PilX
MRRGETGDMRTYNIHGAFKERGTTLVVSLILLLVLTVLGVSGMSSSTLELTMASNSQYHQDAFQAAETGIDIAIATRNFTTMAPSLVPLTPLGDGTYATQGVTTFAETTPVPDAAFSMGVNSGTVQAFHFDIVSVGTGPRNANSTHNQSFYVVGPGGS